MSLPSPEPETLHKLIKADLSQVAARQPSLLDRAVLTYTASGTLEKLSPRKWVKNPAISVVLAGAALTLVESIARPSLLDGSITIFLVGTVLFAILAEATVEARRKAQADIMRRVQANAEAWRVRESGVEECVPAAVLLKGDVIACEAGDVIPSDGEVIEGAASVDECALTSEVPMDREPGDGCAAVIGGTRVLAGRIVVRITAEAGQTVRDHMIASVESGSNQEAPAQRWVGLILQGLTEILLLAIVALALFEQSIASTVSLVAAVAILVCLIPTTIGASLSSVRFAGRSRLLR